MYITKLINNPIVLYAAFLLELFIISSNALFISSLNLTTKFLIAYPITIPTPSIYK